MSSAHSPTFPSLQLRHNSFSIPSVALPTPQLSSFSNLSVTSSTSQLILQPLRCFTYVTTHSPTLSSLYLRPHSSTLPLLHLRHSSFSNPSVTSPTSQLILQPFRRFTYVTAQLILQPFRHFTYVTTHSPNLALLDLRHSSFSNPSGASPTSQLILQPFYCLSNVTGSSLNSPGEPLMIDHQHCKLRSLCC